MKVYYKVEMSNGRIYTSGCIEITQVELDTKRTLLKDFKDMPSFHMIDYLGEEWFFNMKQVCGISLQVTS